MKLYAYLASRLPPWLAIGITALWLAVVVFLALFFSMEPTADFRYGNL